MWIVNQRAGMRVTTYSDSDEVTREFFPIRTATLTALFHLPPNTPLLAPLPGEVSYAPGFRSRVPGAPPAHAFYSYVWLYSQQGTDYRLTFQGLGSMPPALVPNGGGPINAVRGQPLGMVDGGALPDWAGGDAQGINANASLQLRHFTIASPSDKGEDRASYAAQANAFAHDLWSDPAFAPTGE